MHKSTQRIATQLEEHQATIIYRQSAQNWRQLRIMVSGDTIADRQTHKRTRSTHYSARDGITNGRVCIQLVTNKAQKTIQIDGSRSENVHAHRWTDNPKT